MVRQSLDMAIARVAEDEFSRLSGGKTPEECVNCVTQALKSLGGLQWGNAPEYNEWDALFYLTWYQPRQINIALAVLRRFFSGQPLHIIDVGCGALAVQFAVAVAIAEKQLVGSEVTVQGIDPSESMRRIGEELWLKFWSIVYEDRYLSNLAGACDVLTSSCNSHDSKESYYKMNSPGTECWLIAVHAVYESNKEDIRNTFAEIRSKFAPMLEIVTTHPSKRDVAWSMTGEEFNEEYNEADSQCTFPETTAWRKHLIDRLSTPGAIFEDIVCNYLGREVPSTDRAGDFFP